MISLLEKVQAAFDFKVTGDPPSSILSFISQYGNTDSDSLDSVTNLITGLISLALTFAGVIAFAMLLWGIFGYFYSPNEEKVKKSTATITWSLIGLVIVAAASTIVYIVKILLKSN
jgi:hypothetical protein